MKPAKRRNSVVLPHPEGPRIVRNSPFLTDKLTLSRTTLSGKFFVTLDYEELENGGLSEFVSVIIKLDDGNEYYRGYLKDLFDDEVLLNMCFEANVSQKITITYLMPIEVGNEAMHTYSDFNINITIKRNAGE